MILRLLIATFFTCACINLQAQVNIITTIAGKAHVPASDSGDGDIATNARFYGPVSVCLDAANNIYIADAYNNKIRKINSSTWTISTIAGTGAWGYSGDGGAATNSQLYIPEDIQIDKSGNIYIADANNNRIRKIDTQGIITTIAGNGAAAFGGDGSAATNASLNQPSGLCLDKCGNIYIADYTNNRVRKVDASTGFITTIAGNGSFGYTGDNGLAVNATIAGPLMIYADTNCHVFFSDHGNHAIRKINAVTGIITTIVGTGTAGNTGDGGLAIHAQSNNPAGLFIDKQNNIFIAEFGKGLVRRIDAVTGIITTIAGNGTWGHSGDGGPATAAELSCTDLVIDSYGCMIVADYGTNTIRKVYNPQLNVNALAANDKVTVYPNPATDKITIEYSFSNKVNAILQIVDITGRILVAKTLPVNKEKEEIDIHAFSQGLYLYKVMQKELTISTGKIIKE